MSRPPIAEPLIEDVEWMDQHGESLDGAAHRLRYVKDHAA